MAKTFTVTIPSIHWFTYPIIVGSLLFVVWLWHDTKVKDAAAKQAVTATTTAQVAVDKTVTAANKSAEADLKVANEKLAKQLKDAKTAKQQAEVINKGAGTFIDPSPWLNYQTVPAQPPYTNLGESKSQATNPSSVDQPLVDAPSFKISPEDLQKLAALTIEKQQADNQIAVDKLELAGKDQQIAARDDRIAAQDTEIKTLKGGSHFKRFLKAAKYVVIGGAIGAGAVYASHH